MSQNNVDINKVITAEGFRGDTPKKEFVTDPWIDIYAARQNDTILQEKAVAVEEHQIEGKKFPCLIVRLGNVKGLIPIQESGTETHRELRQLVGQYVAFKVVTFDRESELVLLSRKKAREHMARVTWEKLEEGNIVTCSVRFLRGKYADVDIGGVSARLYAEDVSWGWTHDMRDVMQVGDAFDAKVIEIDKENEKVKVSIKETLPCPWPDAATRYEKGNQYLGKVSGIAQFGVFVNLEPGVDGSRMRGPKTKWEPMRNRYLFVMMVLMVTMGGNSNMI